MKQNNIRHVFVDAGTGTTAAALVLGLDYLKVEANITVVQMAGGKNEFEKTFQAFYKYFTELLKINTPIPSNYQVIKPTTAKSFGSCNTTILQEVINAARTEGLFVDPIYTAKLLFTVKKEMPKEKTLWIHSGGALSLAGFTKDLLKLI